MQTDFEMKYMQEGFSENELIAMHETELFRLKYRVIDKVVIHFSRLSSEVRKVAGRHRLPAEIAQARARIFRGENYKLLPYAVMDYPALYSRENSFAYRTMFWWGNFFSFTLYLHGTYLDMYRKNLQENIGELKGKNFYFCIHQSPWQYYYEKDNYILLDEMPGKNDLRHFINEREFIKLSRWIKISEWNTMNDTCIETLELLLKSIGAGRIL